MSKKLVAYFSAQGHTAKRAAELAKLADADLYEIRPAEPYTPADLDWMNARSRSSVEMNDPASRPKLADLEAPVAENDVIYLGFPIWWYTAPHIVASFLESYDFSGKRIVVFATSGSSELGSTVGKLADSAPQATVVEGGMANQSASLAKIAAKGN